MRTTLFLVLLSLSLSYSTTNLVPFKERFDHALFVQRSGHVKQAISLYRLLLAQEPQSKEVLSNLASALQTIDPHSTEALHLYYTAVQYYPKHPRLRVNYATAMLAQNREENPQAALDQLSVAQTLVHPKDTKSIGTILQNSASVASQHQLWSRSKVEKYYLAAKAIQPDSRDAGQNLLLFQQQEREAAKRSEARVSKRQKDKAVCCSPKVLTHLCHAVMELADNKRVGQAGRDESCQGDDFCNLSLSEIQAATLVACEGVPSTNINTTTIAAAPVESPNSSAERTTPIAAAPVESPNSSAKRTTPNALIKHIHQWKNCYSCSQSREGKILEKVLDLKERTIKTVLNGMDSMSTWHMSMGQQKCSIIQKAIRKHHLATNNKDNSKDNVHVEIGGYIGYSALCVAEMASVRSIYSVEHNPIFVAVARTIIDFAQMNDKISIHVGSTLDSFHNEFQLNSLLLDHWKDKYLDALLELESSSLLSNSVVVIADNVVHPGVPIKFLNHVRGMGDTRHQVDGVSVTWESESISTGVEHLELFDRFLTDAVEVSTRTVVEKSGSTEGSVAASFKSHQRLPQIDL